MELLYKEEVYAIVGAMQEVYYQLGPGFLEPVYQEALEIELARRGIPFEAQKALVIYYKGQPLKKEYVADFVCYGKIIVEIKAIAGLTAREEAQLLNYLKVTKMRVGLLCNFCSQSRLDWKRYVI